MEAMSINVMCSVIFMFGHFYIAALYDYPVDTIKSIHCYCTCCHMAYYTLCLRMYGTPPYCYVLPIEIKSNIYFFFSKSVTTHWVKQ